MGTRPAIWIPGSSAYLARTEQHDGGAASAHGESRVRAARRVGDQLRHARPADARQRTDVRAAEAVALFCYQARKWIGAFAAALGGLDTLVFSGGIGENAAARSARGSATASAFSASSSTRARNAADAPLISTDAGRVTVRVIRTDEELMIARIGRAARFDSVAASRDPDHDQATRSRRTCCDGSTPTGAPPTICRSARSICCDNPLLKRPLALADVKPQAARPLGHDAGAELHLRAPEPGHQEVRPRHDLHLRPGPRRPGGGGQHLSRRHLQRDLSRHQPGRGRAAEAVQAVLVSRRHSQPRIAGVPGLDPRGRRARLLAQPRLRRGVRQPRRSSSPASSATARRKPARWPRRGTQQVSRSGARRRGAADPASERLQDRQPSRARAHHARGTGAVAPRLRLDAATSSRATSRR